MAVGFAYQIKHASGDLDLLYYPLSVRIGYWIFGATAAVIAIGLVIARLKSKLIGIAIAGLAIAALAITSAWSLTSADRALAQSRETDSNGLP
jgi:hypothetical protein